MPHPFEESQLPADSALLAIPEAYGIVVEPISGASPARSDRLRDGMIKALQEIEIPAFREKANARSYHLTGAIVPDQPQTGAAGRVRWQLSDWQNHVLGTDAQTIPTAPGLDRGSISVSGFQTEAARLAALIAPPAPVEAQPARQFHVAPVEGAPGDGSISLSKSLAYLLERAGEHVTDTVKGDGIITIRGHVTIVPVPPHQENVKIDWTVLRPDGKEIGQVSQQNTIAAGSLDGAWSEIAMAVASAARDDLLALAARIQPGEHPPP